MPRQDVTQSVVLERILERLRSQLTLNDRNCYEVAGEDYVPILPKSGDYFVTVALGPGTLGPEEEATVQCIENSTVDVTIWTRTRLDATDHDQQLLRDTRRGLLVLKRDVLKALVGHDLLDDKGNTFLRDLVYAERCSPPTVMQHEGTGALLGKLTISFAVNFDWDLTD